MMLQKNASSLEKSAMNLGTKYNPKFMCVKSMAIFHRHTIHQIKKKLNLNICIVIATNTFTKMNNQIAGFFMIVSNIFEGFALLFRDIAESSTKVCDIPNISYYIPFGPWKKIVWNKKAYILEIFERTKKFDKEERGSILLSCRMMSSLPDTTEKYELNFHVFAGTILKYLIMIMCCVCFGIDGKTMLLITMFSMFAVIVYLLLLFSNNDYEMLVKKCENEIQKKIDQYELEKYIDDIMENTIRPNSKFHPDAPLKKA